MRDKQRCFLYRNRQLIGEYPSITQAATAGGETLPTARSVINGIRQVTKKGNVYSTKELTEKEIQNLPIRRFNDNCKEHVSNTIEYEVSCSDHRVCYTGRNRQERLMMLKEFIYKQMDYKWKTQPYKITCLQQKFLKEIFDDLMI